LNENFTAVKTAMLLAVSCVVGIAMLFPLTTEAPAASTRTEATSSYYGGFGPEGSRMREQLWILPSGDPEIAQRATLFRPQGGNLSRYPLVVINHGTAENSRLSTSMPVYYWLSRWFVQRGYAVLLPQRRGHGATGGSLAEAVGNCANPDHYRSGMVAAQDIGAAIDFMRDQPFVDPARIVVAGISTGGWASLALAAQRPELVAGVINFAGGRGGHAYGQANRVCGTKALVNAAHRYASSARAPTLWLYAENDSYFGPQLASRLASAWASGGGLVEYDPLPAYSAEGHGIADDRAGWDVWGKRLDRFLATYVKPTKEPQVAQGP
jgi:dipeptidyl aminopeptidase/acylaminoacyl peptidase